MKVRVTGRTRPTTAKASQVAGREGFVIPAVIFALAIMGVLAAVSLRTADDERRSSRALRESGAALYAAEAGSSIVRGTVTDTSGTTLFDSIALTLAPGDSADLGWLPLPNGGSYNALIQRVDDGSDSLAMAYTLTAEGRGRGLRGGQRAITMVLAGSPKTGIGFEVEGTMSMYSPPTKSVDVKFSGGSFLLRGDDWAMPSGIQDPANIPAGCSAPISENMLALQLDSDKAAGEIGDNVPKNKEGSFKGLKPGSTTNEYTEQNSFGTDPGGMTLDDVIALADFLKPGATVIPTPDSYSDNFGTPTSPAVFLADGNVSLGGSGRGYGILIVTGELTLTGSFRWEGLILAVGAGIISITGSDNHVYGAILVASTGNGGTILDIAGNGGAYYSSQAICRLREAGLLGSPGGIFVVPGSWMQLSR